MGHALCSPVRSDDAHLSKLPIWQQPVRASSPSGAQPSAHTCIRHILSIHFLGKTLDDAPNQELFDGRISQQRRFKVKVQMGNIPLVFFRIFWRSRTLVNAHRVREGALEEVVVADSDIRNDARKG